MPYNFKYQNKVIEWWYGNHKTAKLCWEIQVSLSTGNKYQLKSKNIFILSVPCTILNIWFNSYNKTPTIISLVFCIIHRKPDSKSNSVEIFTGYFFDNSLKTRYNPINGLLQTFFKYHTTNFMWKQIYHFHLFKLTISKIYWKNFFYSLDINK